jgi:hypothetical protein
MKVVTILVACGVLFGGAAATGTPDQHAWLVERFWTWRGLLILLPAAGGLALLLGHVLFRLARWFISQPPSPLDSDSMGLEGDRKLPSPLIISLVEFEKRRAARRGQFGSAAVLRWQKPYGRRGA